MKVVRIRCEKYNYERELKPDDIVSSYTASIFYSDTDKDWMSQHSQSCAVGDNPKVMLTRLLTSIVRLDLVRRRSRELVLEFGENITFNDAIDALRAAVIYTRESDRLLAEIMPELAQITPDIDELMVGVTIRFAQVP